MRERKIFEQPLGGQLSPAKEGSVKKSLRGAVNYGKGGAKCPAHAVKGMQHESFLLLPYR